MPAANETTLHFCYIIYIILYIIYFHRNSFETIRNVVVIFFWCRRGCQNIIEPDQKSSKLSDNETDQLSTSFREKNIEYNIHSLTFLQFVCQNKENSIFISSNNLEVMKAWYSRYFCFSLSSMEWFSSYLSFSLSFQNKNKENFLIEISLTSLLNLLLSLSVQP